MMRLLFILWSCLVCLAVTPAAVLSSAELPQSIPGRNTPKKLTEVWLRFHDQDLCLGIDADFAFNGNGMEVRGFFKDRSLYEKFEAMLHPLRSSYDIDLHLEPCPEEKKTGEDKEKNPPASLWENLELRSFLGDAIARARERIDFDDDLPFDVPPPNEMLKQRLLIYAEKVLEWDRKMELYAKHLPDLARVSQDPALPPGLRARAGAVVNAHVRKMGKLLSSLQSNLERAFPRPENPDGTTRPEKSEAAAKNMVDYAGHLSDYAQTVSQRIHQFIFPERFTVNLDELRRPSLLEALKTLRKMSAGFQKAYAKTN
jgi:hypothetical protein